MYRLKCIECGKEWGDENYTCECGGLLEVEIDLDEVEIDFRLDGSNITVWKYRSLLPVKIDPVTLKEGGTPLYRAERLEKEVGVRRVYVKHEGLNPSGSFKDRGMTVGVTKALELGRKAVACASTGNTSASMAMYAAKAGLKAYVLLPAGKVALGKVAQALMHGAKVIGIDGNFDDALRIVREVCSREPIYLLNSINPFRPEGQKTIAYEIADEIGVPDRVVLPVGNAGNISAIYKGFKELREVGLTDSMPKMTGIQAEGAAPIYRAFKEGKEDITPMENPETIATAIRIGNPVSAKKALRAIYSTNGLAEVVSDSEIIEAQKFLAAKEGIGVEPASAASVAGLRKLAANGMLDPDETIVCVVTGNLLKDPETVVRVCGEPVKVEASVEAVIRAMRA
ncbi:MULTISPECIES: threonine synthase [Archaeoglobus]|uniref:Threonine synthase n=2 Tax=Archaeoglobus fulgidus TaxID=2234 RepID=O28953_ARCFU|nr:MULTISPECIES: threonine synthase [Archaeoglobus]AAB89930.1 threonine synthase (thrC-2) [Archaeoglobus fulgidus DSM 4304]AIG98195.1 threonine synthase [Archaeoglobus fulgidus DSM 8774]MDI3498078.1 threonine synthase [Archaeoglobus sp.]